MCSQHGKPSRKPKIEPPRSVKSKRPTGIILEQTILKLVGRDVGTEVESDVKDNSIVLKRHLAYRPPLG